LLGLTLCSRAAGNASQDKVVQGTVTEAGSNEPLAGASVHVKGTTSGTTTDYAGRYLLTVPSEDAILVFSYTGKKTEERSVKGLSSIHIVMENEDNLLSEVYVGYMMQRKADVTGSIAMATAADIAKNPSANAMKSLQGKLAGVHITTNGGNPAEGVSVQIRGLSSLSGGVTPLIVLDGMPTQNLNLRDINAGDIESIQVLKDAASASIYGARASGGVILIQTKKGKTGQTSVSYDGSVALSTVIDKPTLMNAEHYGVATFAADAYDEQVYGIPMSLPGTYDFTWHRDANGRPVLESAKPAAWLNPEQTVPGSDTDWLGELLQPAMM